MLQQVRRRQGFRTRVFKRLLKSSVALIGVMIVSTFVALFAMASSPYLASKLIGPGTNAAFIIGTSATNIDYSIGSSVSSDYIYRIPIRLTNTGIAQTDLIVFADVDNDLLADNGFIESDALDTNVEEGVTARAYLPRDSKLGFYLPTLAQNETKIVTYELGYSPEQTDFYFMAGPDGSVTTADAANLEPGASNFEAEWSGYFDATKTGDLIAKGASFGLISATAGQVTAFIGAFSSTYVELLPNAAGYISEWSITRA